MQGILSPGLIGSFVLLGLFPLIAKKIVDGVKARQVYARWAGASRRTFDRNLVVIGAGAAGLVTAYIAAAVKAKVTLVEAHKMGGDCLNYGCVPSKALIKTATLARQMRHARDYGIARAEATIDFAQVMERVARHRARDRAARFGRALHRRWASMWCRAMRGCSTRGRWRSPRPTAARRR